MKTKKKDHVDFRQRLTGIAISLVIVVLAILFIVKPSLTGFLIQEANINENNLILKLAEMINPDSPFVDADWIDFQYKGKRNKSPTINFNLSPKCSYEVLLKTEQKVHGVADTIFRRCR